MSNKVLQLQSIPDSCIVISTSEANSYAGYKFFLRHLSLPLAELSQLLKQLHCDNKTGHGWPSSPTSITAHKRKMQGGLSSFTFQHSYSRFYKSCTQSADHTPTIAARSHKKSRKAGNILQHHRHVIACNFYRQFLSEKSSK